MIEAFGLTKVYGHKKAVDDLTFTVQPGVVTGFLGPNGAGKSTTIRMLLGMIVPTAGHADLFGERVRGISRARVNEVADLVGLQDVARKRAGGFSLGMGQRLGIASALLGDRRL